MSKLLVPFFSLLALVVPGLAHAFPELARAGYVNCTSCHYSPAGGGLLTTYGRALSKEVLSHGSFFFERVRANQAKQAEEAAEDESAPKEEDFLYGAAGLPQWLSLGGDLRFLQTYSDNQNMTDARFIVMQLDLEGRVSYKRVALQATAGRKDPGDNATRATDSLVSHRHWLQFMLGPEGNEDRVQLRGGRFYPAYGLMIPDHNVITRAGLGFDADQETYNAEASYIDENVNVFATGIFGRPDASNLRVARGAALQLWKPLGTTSKIGVDGLTRIAAGASEAQRQNLAGVNAIVGFTPHLYSLFEADGTQSVVNHWGSAEYLKFGWEFTQGVHIYLDQEFGRPTYADSNQRYENYGVGTQYFPRTHWEFLLSVNKQRTYALSRQFDTNLWFLIHYYL